MGLLNGLFGLSEPTPEERRKARNDKRETRRIVGERDTGEIADATAAGSLSIDVERDGSGVTSKAYNRRGNSWPGQRISETPAEEPKKGSLGW
jgi:hypothetical protein